MVSKLRREIFLYVVCQKGSSSGFSPPWVQSVFTVALVRRGAGNVQLSASPSLSVTISADCVGEKMNVQVCASCVPQRFAPVIKDSWAEPELVIIVLLIRTSRMDVRMYSSVHTAAPLAAARLVTLRRSETFFLLCVRWFVFTAHPVGEAAVTAVSSVLTCCTNVSIMFTQNLTFKGAADGKREGCVGEQLAD